MTENRQIRAIMFTDIVGYTAKMERDEVLAVKMMEEHNTLVHELVKFHEGHIVKHIGDEVLADFNSAVPAVRCAVDLQSRLVARNKGLPDSEQLWVRIGVHIGDVIIKDNDIFGDGVNVASRVRPMAKPGGICITQAVYDFVKNQVDIQCVELGDAQLKNVTSAVHIYAVVVQALGKEYFVKEEMRPRSRTIMYAGVAATLAVIAFVAYLLLPSSPYPSYERAFYETRYEKALDKSQGKRSLTNLGAHWYHLRSLERISWSESGFPVEVLNEYRELVRENPSSASARCALALAFYSSARTRAERDSAWLLLEEAEGMGLKDPYEAIQRMDVLSAMNLTAQALEQAAFVSKEYKDNPLALFRAGQLFYRFASDTARAKQLCQAAVALYPDYVSAHGQLAAIARDEGNMNEAKAILATAERINPESMDVIEGYAAFFKKEGRFDKAEEYYRKALEGTGENKLETYGPLADILLAQDKIADGVKLLESVPENSRRHPMVVWYRRQFIMRDQWLKTQKAQAQTETQVRWEENYDKAVAIARRERKPLLIDFYATWCYPCKMLDDQTFPDPSVQKAMQSYVPLKVNTDVEVALKNKYKIDFFPFIAVLSPEGDMVHQIVGFKKPQELVNELASAMSDYAKYVKGKTESAEKYTEVSNLNDALIIARSKKIPIMATFYSKQSASSSRLLNETLPDPAFQGSFTDVVLLKVDESANKDLVSRWNVRWFPTVVFLDYKGATVASHYGFVPAGPLSELVEKVKTANETGRALPAGINWLYDLEEAKSLSLTSQRNIFLEVGARWAPGTKWMDETTFPSPPVIKELNDKFVSVKLDERRDRDAVNAIGVIMYPTFVVLSSSGSELFRTAGFKQANELMEWLKYEDKMRIIAMIGAEKYKEFQKKSELANSLSIRQQYESAARIYTELLQDAPTLDDLYMNLGRMYSKLRRTKPAIEYYQKGIERGAKVADDMVELENLYLEAKDTTSIFRLLDVAKKQAAGNGLQLSNIYLGLSNICEILQDNTRALANAREALKSSPADYRAHVQVGRMCFLTGSPGEGERVLEKAKGLEKQNAEAIFYLALIAGKRGNQSLMDKLLSEVRAQGPVAAYQIGWRDSYQERRNYAAYPGYLKLIEEGLRYKLMLEPDNEIFLNGLAYFWAGVEKNLDEASQMMDRALQKMPQEPALIDTKGWVLYKQGKLAEADSVMRKVVELVSDRQMAVEIEYAYHLGKIKAALGDKADAEKYFSFVLNKLEPNPLEETLQQDVRQLSMR